MDCMSRDHFLLGFQHVEDPSFECYDSHTKTIRRGSPREGMLSRSSYQKLAIGQLIGSL